MVISGSRSHQSAVTKKSQKTMPKTLPLIDHRPPATLLPNNNSMISIDCTDIDEMNL
jgi:hypothetical protein